MLREVISLRRIEAMAPDEAAAFLAMRRSDDPQAIDETLFQQWLQRDQANRAAWERARKVFALFDHARGDELVEEMRLHALEAQPEQSWSWARTSAVAAALLAIVTGAVFLSPGSIPGSGDGGRQDGVVARPHGDAPAARGVRYATGIGEVRTEVLPDGSRMTIDTASTVVGDFSGAGRRLRLVDGRAFLSVRHDPARPFVVLAGDGEVRALGTRFEVRLDPGQLKVVLEEGKLAVRTQRSAPAVMMSGGQQLVARSGHEAVLSRARLDEASNWQQGLATFDDVTLRAAAAELNRYSNDRLVVRDPQVAGLRVTGMFRTGDPERFGRALAQIYPVRAVRRGGNEVEIVPSH
jgi:transmembrane sensor